MPRWSSAVFLFLASSACASAPAQAPSAPPFELRDLTGDAVSLADYAGKNVYVKFWASWCSICTSGFPDVTSLAADTTDDIEVLTVVSPTFNGEKSEAAFTTWARSRELGFPVLLDTGGAVASAFQVTAYPTSVWLDGDGKVLATRNGHVSNAEIVERFSRGPDTPKAPESTRFPPNPNAGIDYSGVELKEITVAGGCFWGVEAFMTRIPGVADAASGYANGPTPHPTYEEVCAKSGHAEAVRVRYDPRRVSLDKLLRLFVGIIDPTLEDRQGNDRGVQYRTGIYFHDKADRDVARAILAEEQARLGQKVVTEVLPLRQFSEAEGYHQDYLEKNPDGYCHHDFSSLTRTP